jgi:putative peptidoglycan lipid II flippase
MVSRLIKNGTNIMFQRQTSILSAAGVMMVLTLGSAFLGVYKLHLLSGLDIATNRDALDAFKAAFRIPDLVFQIVIAGALNAAFIPVFGEMMDRKHPHAAWSLMSNLINLCIGLFAVAAVVIFLLAEPFTRYLVAPGYDADTIKLTADLTRLMMLSPILLGVSAFFSGSLQVQHRFLIPAIAPILYNLGLIVGIATFYPHQIFGIHLPGFGVWGLAYGVILGSIAHLLIQAPLMYHLGFNYSLLWGWKDKAVQQVAKLMLPRTIGISIDQLEAQVATMLVSTLGKGSVFLFGQVFSLVTFPISFFGVSIAQAAFPTLSKEAVEDKDAFRTTLLTTFHQILYLIVPVAVLLTVLKLPAVRVLLNAPDWTRTLVAAQVLLSFTPLLVAQSAIHLWARAFYALKDSISPLAAAAAGVIVSVFISILTLPVLGMRGLGLGMSIGSFVSLGMLMYLMHKRIGGFTWHNLAIPSFRILLAGAIMSAAVYLPIKPIEALFLDTTTTINLILLSVLVSWFGLSLYLLLSWLLGSQEIIMFIRLAHKLRSWREALVKMPAAYQQGLSGDITSES